MTLEELTDQFTELQANFETMKQEKENIEKTLQEKEDRINKLVDYNQKLFLKISTPVEEKEENKDNEYIEYVGKEFFDKLSNKEKDKLRIILEGEDE